MAKSSKRSFSNVKKQKLASNVGLKCSLSSAGFVFSWTEIFWASWACATPSQHASLSASHCQHLQRVKFFAFVFPCKGLEAVPCWLLVQVSSKCLPISESPWWLCKAACWSCLHSFWLMRPGWSPSEEHFFLFLSHLHFYFCVSFLFL